MPSPSARLKISSLTVFYTLLITQTFSLIGSRVTTMAVGIWVFSQTGQTAPLLLTSFFTELPGMLGGSLAGVLVDRWNRKWVMILADMGQAVGSLALLVSLQSGQFQLWHLYGVALLQGFFNTFQGPAESATITLLIPDSHRDRANAIQELAFPLAGIIAPVLAGLLYLQLGVSGVIALDLGTFVIAALVVAALPIPSPRLTVEGQAGQGRMLTELRVGLRYFKQRRPLLVFVLYLAFIDFLLNGPLDLVIPYFLSLTHDETQMGLGLSLMSLGAFTGALLLTVFNRTRPRMRVILMGMTLTGSMFLIFGAARSLPVLGLSLFLIMLPLPINNALRVSILQLKTPPDLQGRVFALVSQLALLGSTLSFLFTGLVVDRWLEPLVHHPVWDWVAPLVGNQPGSGIGLLLMAVGLTILTATGLVFSRRTVRRLEADLPDYETG